MHAAHPMMMKVGSEFMLPLDEGDLLYLASAYMRFSADSRAGRLPGAQHALQFHSAGNRGWVKP